MPLVLAAGDVDFMALSTRASQATMIVRQQHGRKDAVLHLDVNQGSLKEQSGLQLSRAMVEGSAVC